MLGRGIAAGEDHRDWSGRRPNHFKIITQRGESMRVRRHYNDEWGAQRRRIDAKHWIVAADNLSERRSGGGWRGFRA
jgi:hypothetical protein